jgi:hypothetical protein
MEPSKPPYLVSSDFSVDEEAQVANASTSTELGVESEDTNDDNVMALQLSDSLNRTFAELKSKHEDVRLRASYDLHALLTTAARGTSLITTSHPFADPYCRASAG